MIRLAKENDVPRMVEMGERFRRETSYAKFLSKNPSRMEALGKQLMTHDGLLASEEGGKLVGMLGYITHDHFISGDKMVGEVFWWVEPEHRGEGLKLVLAMEKKGRENGAVCSQLVAPDERTGNFYKLLGYEFVEATYQRKL